MATALLRRTLRPRHTPRILTPFRTYAVSTPAPGKRTAVVRDGDDSPGILGDLEDVPAQRILAETGVNRKDVQMQHFTGTCVLIWVFCCSADCGV